MLTDRGYPLRIPCDHKFLGKIESQGAVSGIGNSGGFFYQFDFSIPKIAVAIHAGHQVRHELRPLLALAPDQRMFEEDTGTDFMIQGQPNTIWGLESRAVYDLNRDTDMALPLVPKKFWGTRVYKKAPTPEMNTRSLGSHEAFYRAMGTLITHMLDLFGYCVVYDIHSYNISRQQAKGFESPPVFNLGTAALDSSRWKSHIESWLDRLGAISLPGIQTTVAENLVFSGRGEFCMRLSQWDPRILVLPTEVSKGYMDEFKGAIYHDTIKAVKDGLAQAMTSHLS
jgi:hypothetical protein